MYYRFLKNLTVNDLSSTRANFPSVQLDVYYSTVEAFPFIEKKSLKLISFNFFCGGTQPERRHDGEKLQEKLDV